MNHLDGLTCIGRKNELYSNLKAYCESQRTNVHEIAPPTFIVTVGENCPEYAEFSRICRQMESRSGKPVQAVKAAKSVISAVSAMSSLAAAKAPSAASEASSESGASAAVTEEAGADSGDPTAAAAKRGAAAGKLAAAAAGSPKRDGAGAKPSGGGPAISAAKIHRHPRDWCDKSNHLSTSIRSTSHHDGSRLHASANLSAPLATRLSLISAVLRTAN